MNFRMIARSIGVTLCCVGALTCLSLIVSLIYGESVWPFTITAAIFVSAGVVLLSFKPKTQSFFAKESFFIVTVSWIIVSAIGCLPFVFSGSIPNYIDAFFETVSGFTTTGATILTDIESLPRGILFWRSFTHWIGGMGVIVFVMAIMPLSKESAMFLARAEMPGPVISKLVPKMHNTAVLLYGIYIVLSVMEFLLLLCGGMPVYDSLIHTFGTAGTGGFSIMNLSIGHYSSAYIQWVIAVFMLLFGINFNMYFLILLKDFRQVLRNEELRVYLGVVLGATAIVCANLCTAGERFSEAIRAAFFQVTSIITTTGYSTVNFDVWPSTAKFVLFLLMFFGACAGSTGGGMKISRIVIIFKTLKSQITGSIHPRTVSPARLNGKPMEESVIRHTAVFAVVYFSFFLLGALLISVDGYDMITCISASATCLSNVGPGFSGVGPMANYSQFSAFSKLVLSLQMLLGRLELFPVLTCLSPLMYKHRKLK